MSALLTTDLPVESLAYVLDLAGTFVFALSGATAGIKRKLDVFGILVLAFVAANTGGIIRDILIGATPPAAINDWRYLGVSLLAGLLTFYFPAAILQRWNPVLLFDAAGLALFAVSGAHKAVVYGLNPVMATLLGMLTGIGGGMARDVLLAEIPTVLRADLYAVAALAGAAIVVVANMLQLPSGVGALCGATLCFGLRVLAIRHTAGSFRWRMQAGGVPGRRISQASHNAGYVLCLPHLSRRRSQIGCCRLCTFADLAKTRDQSPPQDEGGVFASSVAMKESTSVCPWITPPHLVRGRSQ